MELTKDEKRFLMDMLDEFVQEAEEVEQRDSLLTQNLARFVHDENKVDFLQTLRNKIKKLPVK